MIQPVKFPPAVSLAENPVVVGLKTNNDITASGTKAKLVLHFAYVIATGTGYQFRITFGGNTYTFSMAVTPDDSGLQFPIAIIGDDNLTWMKKIMDTLKAHYYISDLYDLSYTYNQVHITAKSPGSAYDITGANISVLGLSVAAYPATDQQVRSFFKIFLQVMMGNTVIGEDSLPVDTSHKAFFDISEYLQPELSSNLTFPESFPHLMLLHPESCKEFSIRYCEFFSENDTPLHHKMTQAGPFKVLTGGVNSMTQARYNSYNTNWYNQLLINHMFLSWHPGKKKTAQYDVQKLYYLVHTDLHSHDVEHVNLYTGINYTLNGTKYNQLTFKASIAASKGALIEICCGYSRLGLDTEASAFTTGSVVNSYDVFLKDDAGNIISEVRNFLFDADHYENYRQFIFKNSFKVYETIRCTAVQEREAGYENVIIEHTRKYDFTERSADNKKDKSFETTKYIVNTGWITASELDWTRELFLSKEVYEIIDGKLFPVVITGAALNIGKDDETLHNAVIEYVHAFTDEHYSKATVLKPGIIHVDIPIEFGVITGSISGEIALFDVESSLINTAEITETDIPEISLPVIDNSIDIIDGMGNHAEIIAPDINNSQGNFVDNDISGQVSIANINKNL